LCALRRERQTPLPDDRLDLYRIALEMLLERRDVERRVRTPRPLPLKDAVFVLQDLAHWLVLNGESEGDMAAVIDRFQSRLTTMGRSTIDAHTVYSFLLERSGILREPVVGRVDFIHRTFQEYLAALEAVEQDNIGLLLRFAEGEDWHEVVVLAAGLGNARQRCDLVERLLRLGDERPALRERSHLLAVSCAAVARGIPDELRGAVSSRLQQILPPSDRDHADRLAAAGDLCVSVLKTMDFADFADESKCASIALLARIATDAAMYLVGSLVDGASTAVAEEAVRAWPNFPVREYANVVLLRAPLPSLITVRSTELARLASSLPLVPAVRCELSRLDSLSLLEGCGKIRELIVHDAHSMPTIGWCASIAPLHVLSLNECTQLVSLFGISQFRSLRRLEVTGAPRLSSIQLGSARRLVDLRLQGLSGVENTWDLAESEGLRHLALSGCPRLSDFRGLAQLSRLKRLRLAEVPIVELRSLAGLARLQCLEIESCDLLDVLDLGPTSEVMPNLREIRLLKCSVSADALVSAAASRPSVKVVTDHPDVAALRWENGASSVRSLPSNVVYVSQ
ncbi:MAG: hypothetical protein LC808_07800, partial [Actinobacteria bacterium]|nr:hypothetical protein [Actinomycetota bacterium]